MTEPSARHYCCCGLTIKDVLQFISSLVLPLMLGVFTVIITLEQQRVTSEQRTQDLNNSAQQRAEDRQMALEQRAQDKLIAKEQREQDERRRLQDLQIAEAKRTQDDQIAQKQRELLEKQRAHELSVEALRYEKETEKYRDVLLVSYMNEINILLINHNGSLTSDPLIATLVRLKTLTITRQLDASRNTQLVQFLYEAGQLMNGQNPLNLKDANFNGIDLSSTTKYLEMPRLSLFGAYLNNASFRNRDLSNANFSNAHLTDASFANTYLTQVDFSTAILLETGFENAHIVGALFDNANMLRVKFSNTKVKNSQFTNTDMRQIDIQSTTVFQRCNFTNIYDLVRMNLSRIDLSNSYFTNVDLRKVVFIDAKISGTHFIKTDLTQSDFSRSDCRESHFKNLELNKVTFTDALLTKSTWFKTRLTNIDFTSANLEAASFVDTIQLENIRFVNAIADKLILSKANLENSNFSRCQCSKAEFIDTKISGVSFDNAKLNYANFSGANMGFTVTFRDIDGSDADFSHSNVISCTFAQARLARADFAWANADFTIFTDADVTGIDFSHAYLENANITQEQLNTVMSLTATFFNNSNLRNPNLLTNNGYGCNVTTVINGTSWQLKPHTATVTMIRQNDNSCFFTVSEPVTMSQVVNISRYQRLIAKGRARVFVLADIWNTPTIVYITALTSDGLSVNHSFRK